MVYTYYLFWFCIIFALYKSLYLYSLSFLILFVTSYLIYTRIDDEYNTLYTLDRLAILLVVIVGFYYYNNNEYKLLPVLCIALVIAVYYFSQYQYKRQIVHILTVIGHLSIMMSC